MLRGMGCPFAHILLDIAPNIFAGCGSTTFVGGKSSVGGVEPDQIGLGNVLVTLFVPQPTKNIALASKNVRRAARLFEGSRLGLSWLVLVIGCADISVSS
jgi:hypothetical protein